MNSDSRQQVQTHTHLHLIGRGLALVDTCSNKQTLDRKLTMSSKAKQWSAIKTKFSNKFNEHFSAATREPDKADQVCVLHPPDREKMTNCDTQNCADKRKQIITQSVVRIHEHFD